MSSKLSKFGEFDPFFHSSKWTDGLSYLRCQEEDVSLTSDALTVLTSMAQQTTLRYALNLIACGRVLARKRRAEQVGVEDLRRAYTYFMDEKRSVQWLKEQQGSLVFDEVGADSQAGQEVMETD